MKGRGLSSEDLRSPPVPSPALRHYVRFVEQVAEGQTVLMEFADPVPCKAVRLSTGPKVGPQDYGNQTDDALEIQAVSAHSSDDPSVLENLTNWVLEAQNPGMPPPITITLHGMQVVWLPTRAAILAPPERMEPLLLALVEFTFYDRELRKLEKTVADSWPGLEADAASAFEVKSTDLKRREVVSRQMQIFLTLSMRHARLAPHLFRPGTHLASLANQLGERLRERSRIEDRHEYLASQLEVFQRIYEMSSQRFSEFQISGRENMLAWIIIVLLAAEGVLLLIEVLHSLER